MQNLIFSLLKLHAKIKAITKVSCPAGSAVRGETMLKRFLKSRQ